MNTSIAFLFILVTLLYGQNSRRLQRDGFIPASGATKSPSLRLDSRLGMNDLGGMHGEHFNVGPSTMVEKMTGSVPATFQLKQNYPNPFNQTTTLFYQLAQPGEIDISVYSVLGQRVATLAKGHQAAGSYCLRYGATDDNGVSLSSGVYIVRLLTSGYVGMIKLVLIR